MNQNDYKPNSHAYRKAQEQETTEKKRVEKVIKGTAKTKKNEARRFADIFISEDVKNVKSYVFMDVLVPTIKKAIVDIVSDGVNMIFFGGTGSRKPGSNTPYVSYRDYSGRKGESRLPASATAPRASHAYEDVVLQTRGEAEEVLLQMDALIDTYGMVTVADLYDMVGLRCDFTANRYGWKNIKNAYVDRCRDGYILRLPKAYPID